LIESKNKQAKEQVEIYRK